MKRTTQNVGLGADPVPMVPVTHFSRIKPEVLMLAWQLVGPSVARNFSGPRPAPLWAIFAACYAEGVEHGMNATRNLVRETV